MFLFLLRSVPKNTNKHTNFSNIPFPGSEGVGERGGETLGESGLYEVRTIRYIVVLPVVIFSRGMGGGGRGKTIVS